MIRELAEEGDVYMKVERMCCRFKGFQIMGRETAKKVEAWEVRRMGEFVTYSKLMEKAGKGESFVFFKFLCLL